MPDARAQYLTIDTTLAMQRAEAAFRALGQAQRIAADATADRFDPSRFNLITRLALYAAMTRDPLLQPMVPEYRMRARNAIGCYRAIREAN